MEVLVAEDERKTRELIVSYLEESGLDVHAVRTGLEAVKAASERRPDAIVLDGLLPGCMGSKRRG